MKGTILVCSLFGLLGCNLAQIVQDGQCDQNIQLQSDFNLNQFLGTWYEIARSPSSAVTTECSSVALTSAGDTLNFVSTAVNNNFLEERSGVAVQGTGARFTVTVDGSSSDFWILSTDYTNYAVAYRCENISPTQRNVYIWELSRTTAAPTAVIQTTISTTLQNLLTINANELTTVQHTETACFQLPVIPLNEPVILTGQCPTNVNVVQNFDVARFLGLWHEIASYYSDSALGTCSRAQYSLNGNVVDVVNSEVINQTLLTISGTATVASTDGSGVLNVVLNILPGVTAQQTLYIIATDYDNYAISYSCENLTGTTRRVFSWMLGRSPTLTDEVQQQVDQVVNANDDLNYAYYQDTPRTPDDCFYFPDPESTTTGVIFRGTCNENIPAMPNFDPVRYMGLWHDIESYQSEFQGGSCNNAFYTLNGGVVDVYNTQVINQTLDTINGVATIDPQANGSGKLIVNFPVAGTDVTTSTNYWILSTDYDTYSLVYSCTNIDEDSRLVFGWKLSRTRELPAQAAIAINSVTANIDVLDERYFVTRDQSPAGCFYYPTHVPGQPVSFRGQCDDNVEVVPNFDVARYLGLWYDIEHYPQDFQRGTCATALYSLGNNGVDVYNTEIVNQQLSTINGTAVVASTDGTAKLTVTFPVEAVPGLTIDSPYWVLDTDYDSYSIVYACTNIDEDNYRVTAWKLSRTQSLTQNAIAAVNAVIDRVPVIRQQYFEESGQSADDCFYYPAFDPLPDSIELPGACPDSISGVPNFSPADYLGLWYEIESYPEFFQFGECGRAEYSLGANGVDVYNTQVVNQTLDVMTGVAQVASNDGSGLLSVTFVVGGVTNVANYYILATDYTDYALVYSCRNLENGNRQVTSWKLSRTRSLSPQANAVMDNVIQNTQGLLQDYYTPTSQSDEACFYYPAFDPLPDSIELPGACPDSISGVPNFSAADYLGLWYEIESYPEFFQFGECGRAEYSLGANGVDVYNTQVVNQTLDVMTGVAQVASNDGSGLLSVTFVVGGVTNVANYYILATDYTDYALVYSCRNLENGNRQVTSWKLSRTRSLSPQANAVMDNVIQNTQGLLQDYYTPTSQSDEACFYYPAFDPLPDSIELPGACPDSISGVPNFSAADYLGLWYEIESYPEFSQFGDCGRAEYSLGANGVDVYNTQVVNQTLDVMTGVAQVASNDGSGLLSVTFVVGGVTNVANYYILATDYTDYALVYSCRNLDNGNRQVTSWKLSRTRSLSPQAIAVMNNVIQNTEGLLQDYYTPTSQSDEACFYYPAFDPLPDSIELPGPCPDSINGVPDFSAADYLGRWYEIESYPEFFQFGDCGRAEYSLGANGVDVYNTQVVNQTLDVMTGVAQVASNDGSGLLSVTFVVGGVTNVANYYILATDYTDYALVYSCRNLDNGNRQVTSWKLSRTRSLSPQASIVMNNAIQNTEGLLQDYYTPTSQSDEACFYIPDLVANQAVEFRGPCNPNVPRMQNFNIQQYVGWWHEIERYPSNVSAECTSSQFEAAGTGYQVVDIGVSGGVGTYSTVTVLASADGRLRRLYPDGSIVDTWVLDTDYETYSLLYSCEDITRDGEEYSRVWSAKHSKARSLTDAAQNSMAPIIADIPVLVSDFYQLVSQSNEACIHYPEQTGDQIFLPGLCDDNIPVVTDFQVADYGGTWYQIERYPQIHEIGDCTGARYTLDESAGVVNVLNWEVVDGTLETIEGTAVPTYDDGTARLTVTLPVRGTEDETVTTPLYVLTTDYVSYSLAYSCVNVNNNNQRQIGVWKLSRERTMPPAGVTAINNYMETRQEFHGPYFREVTHNEDCLEPSGGFIAKSSVFVILVCALLQLLY